MELRSTATRSPSMLYEQSIFSVRLWLEREWAARVASPDLTVRIADSYNGERQIKLAGLGRGDPDVPLTTPYALIVPVTTGAGTDRYNRFAVQTLGIRTALDPDSGRERREYVTPVDVGLGVKVVSTDINEINLIGKIWAENTPDAVVVVKQRRTGFSFRFHLQFDGSFDTPQPADTTGNSSEPSNLVAQSTLILKTLCGVTEEHAVITKTRVGHYSALNHLCDNPEHAVELSTIVRDSRHLDPVRRAQLRQLRGRR